METTTMTTEQYLARRKEIQEKISECRQDERQQIQKIGGNRQPIVRYSMRTCLP
ncbi:MAG: hypothetical protein ACI3YP_05245 [Prevotella sp.]